VRVSTRIAGDLDTNLATTAFRIFQEALTNAVRHARATRVSARLSVNRKRLLMVIVDDGIGLPKGDTRFASSLGLLGMLERARNVGGNLRLRRRRTRGTLVSFVLPLANADR
jgi:signal transduction histidine kinase